MRIRKTSAIMCAPTNKSFDKLNADLFTVHGIARVIIIRGLRFCRKETFINYAFLFLFRCKRTQDRFIVMLIGKTDRQITFSLQF